ncbi:hypothetical protein JCM10296v2_005432 [Rhodotorula toruloides]
MHLPTLLALPLSFLLSTALARPVLDPSALDVEGSWRLPPSFLFPPPPTNLTYTANQGRGEREKRNVIKNPKVCEEFGGGGEDVDNGVVSGSYDGGDDEGGGTDYDYHHACRDEFVEHDD